jgi:hypothetical protein
MLTGARQLTRRPQTAAVQADLPIELRCPKCMLDQMLDPAVLRATVVHLPEDPAQTRRRVQRRNAPRA